MTAKVRKLTKSPRKDNTADTNEPPMDAISVAEAAAHELDDGDTLYEVEGTLATPTEEREPPLTPLTPRNDSIPARRKVVRVPSESSSASFLPSASTPAPVPSGRPVPPGSNTPKPSEVRTAIPAPAAPVPIPDLPVEEPAPAPQATPEPNPEPKPTSWRRTKIPNIPKMTKITAGVASFGDLVKTMDTTTGSMSRFKEHFDDFKDTARRRRGEPQEDRHSNTAVVVDDGDGDSEKDGSDAGVTGSAWTGSARPELGSYRVHSNIRTDTLEEQDEEEEYWDGGARGRRPERAGSSNGDDHGDVTVGHMEEARIRGDEGNDDPLEGEEGAVILKVDGSTSSDVFSESEDSLSVVVAAAVSTTTTEEEEEEDVVVVVAAVDGNGGGEGEDFEGLEEGLTEVKSQADEAGEAAEAAPVAEAGELAEAAAISREEAKAEAAAAADKAKAEEEAAAAAAAAEAEAKAKAEAEVAAAEAEAKAKAEAEAEAAAEDEEDD